MKALYTITYIIEWIAFLLGMYMGALTDIYLHVFTVLLFPGLLLLGYIFLKIKGEQQSLPFWMGQLIIVFAIFMFAAVFSYYHVEDTNRQKAELIIASVNSYQQSHNKIPDSLAVLAPDILDNIPEYQIGLEHNGYDYQRISNTDYVLFYVTDGSGFYYYSNDTKEWKSDD